MTVTDAIDLAAEGKVAEGYACLVRGLHRPEEMVEVFNYYGAAGWELVAVGPGEVGGIVQFILKRACLVDDGS